MQRPGDRDPRSVSAQYSAAATPWWEGPGGGSNRRQQRENLLGPEGPSDAPILRKGNY